MIDRVKQILDTRKHSTPPDALMFNVYVNRPYASVMDEPKINATACAELFVSASDLASALTLEAGDSYPDVFSTSRMVALMEIASSRILRPYLAPGELSVGVTVDVSHTAATPRGVKVVATARYLRREGKLFLFEVTAHDRGGEIGRGTHKRAIIATDRLLAGADKRNRNA